MTAATTLTASLRRTLRTFAPDPARAYVTLSVLHGERTVDADRPAFRALVDAGYLTIIETGYGRGYRRGGVQPLQWRLRITDKGRAALAEEHGGS